MLSKPVSHLLGASLATMIFPIVAAGLELELIAADGSGLGYSGQMLTAGFPLPEGQHKDVVSLRLEDAGGKLVPAQFRVLDRWWYRGGSIRNACVTFPATVSAGATAKFRISDKGGENPQPAIPVTVGTTGDTLVVNSGPLQFAIPKSGGFLDWISFDVNGDGKHSPDEKIMSRGASGPKLTNQEGTKELSVSELTNLSATVEESGPIEAVIRVQADVGTGTNPFGFMARIYATAGKPDLRIDITLKNDILSAAGRILYFDAFQWELPLSISKQDAVVRTGAAVGTQGEPGKVLQLKSGYQLSGSLTGSGASSAGWMDVQDTRWGMTTTVRRFAQQFPKGLEYTTDNTLSIGLWPKGGEDSSGIYWLGDMQWKTHVIGIRFHPASDAGEIAGEFARKFEFYPVAVAPATWYRDTRALPDQLGLLPVSGQVEKPYFESQAAADTLGWRNYGNNGRKYTPTTGGTPQKWKADAYLLSANPVWVYKLEHWARHSTDLRPTHLTGYMHPMATQWSGFTAGGYAWRNWRKDFVEYQPGTAWDAWYPYDDQHAWIAEMEQAYHHTGDRLYLDNLANLGEIYQGALLKYAASDPNHSWAAPRALAWTVELVRTQLSLTGDSSAMANLSTVAEAFALRNQHAFYGCLDARDMQAFPNGMIAGHLLNFYRELPEGKLKRQVFGSLVGIGDYLTRHSWSADNKGIGQMIDRRDVAYYQNDDMGDVVAWLYVMTGNPLYSQKGRIISDLASWWSAWQGARPGRAMTWMLKMPRPDTIPPADITDLKVVTHASRSDIVKLEWTTPQGAKRYDIRASNKDIVDMVTDSAALATQIAWWHASTFDPQVQEKEGKSFIFLQGESFKTMKYSVRSFDSEGDEANMSGPSSPSTMGCCFSDAEIPAAAAVRVKRKPLNRLRVPNLLGRSTQPVLATPLPR